METNIYNYNTLATMGGMIGQTNSFNYKNKIDENKFYYELEQHEKKFNSYDKFEFNKKIYALDKYIQSEILKIYKCEKKI